MYGEMKDVIAIELASANSFETYTKEALNTLRSLVEAKAYL